MLAIGQGDDRQGARERGCTHGRSERNLRLLADIPRDKTGIRLIFSLSDVSRTVAMGSRALISSDVNLIGEQIRIAACRYRYF